MMHRRAALAVGGLAALMGAAPSRANDLYFQMNPNYSTGPRQAFIFGQAGSTGTVSSIGGFSSNFSLGANGFATIDVPISYELAANTIQNNGFKISSQSAVSGYFLSRATYTTDMSYLIDGSKLGTNYVVSTYSGPNGPDQMSVQATADNTTVTLTPKGSASVTVTLNAGQTYMYNRSQDLTGSSITSTKPIAVFSGNLCGNVPAGAFACDHLDEQMPSVDQLSKTYLLGKTPRTGVGGDVYRVVSTQDGTTVKVNGATVATLNKGEFYEGRLPAGAVVEGSAPVLVAQYLVGQSQTTTNTDPAMTVVPGADQWLKSYVFATPSGISDFPVDFVSIVAKSSDLSSLMVGGAAVDTSGFTAIAGTGYSYGSIDVSSSSGPFSITGESEFELLLSGYNNYDTYFTYGGARFSPGASPPPPPPPSDVPETATWAMFIGGFGMIGRAMRRRRKPLPALV